MKKKYSSQLSNICANLKSAIKYLRGKHLANFSMGGDRREKKNWVHAAEQHVHAREGARTGAPSCCSPKVLSKQPCGARACSQHAAADRRTWAHASNTDGAVCATNGTTCTEFNGCQRLARDTLPRRLLRCSCYGHSYNNCGRISTLSYGMRHAAIGGRYGYYGYY